MASLKEIIAAGRSGTLDDAYMGYERLFSSPEFPTYPAGEQRQALKVMVLMKGAPRRPTPAMVEAHRAALPALTQLVADHAEPQDHEMLGICHVVTGDPDTANAIFRAGLTIERERSPSSDLCGRLMKRVAE